MAGELYTVQKTTRLDSQTINQEMLLPLCLETISETGIEFGPLCSHSAIYALIIL